MRTILNIRKVNITLGTLVIKPNERIILDEESLSDTMKSQIRTFEGLNFIRVYNTPKVIEKPKEPAIEEVITEEISVKEEPKVIEKPKVKKSAKNKK